MRFLIPLQTAAVHGPRRVAGACWDTEAAAAGEAGCRDQRSIPWNAGAAEAIAGSQRAPGACHGTWPSPWSASWFDGAAVQNVLAILRHAFQRGQGPKCPASTAHCTCQDVEGRGKGAGSQKAVPASALGRPPVKLPRIETASFFTPKAPASRPARSSSTVSDSSEEAGPSSGGRWRGGSAVTSPVRRVGVKDGLPRMECGTGTCFLHQHCLTWTPGLLQNPDTQCPYPLTLSFHRDVRGLPMGGSPSSAEVDFPGGRRQVPLWLWDGEFHVTLSSFTVVRLGTILLHNLLIHCCRSSPAQRSCPSVDSVIHHSILGSKFMPASSGPQQTRRSSSRGGECVWALQRMQLGHLVLQPRSWLTAPNS